MLVFAYKVLDSEEHDTVMGDITAFVCGVDDTKSGVLNCANPALDVIGDLVSITSFGLQFLFSNGVCVIADIKFSSVTTGLILIFFSRIFCFNIDLSGVLHTGLLRSKFA